GVECALDHASAPSAPDLSRNQAAGADGGAEGDGGAPDGRGRGGALAPGACWALVDDGDRMAIITMSAVVRRYAVLWLFTLRAVSSHCQLGVKKKARNCRDFLDSEASRH